jgi:hypothetical protein
MVKTEGMFGVTVAAMAWFLIAAVPLNSAGAATGIIRRCEERREILNCRRVERLDHVAEAADDEGCGCGGAASAGSGAQAGNQSSNALSADPGGGGQAPGGAAGSGGSGQAAGSGAPGQGQVGVTGPVSALAANTAPNDVPWAERYPPAPDNWLPPIAPVPGPTVGAGLPGLIAACGGLLALARRRRRLIA